MKKFSFFIASIAFAGSMQYGHGTISLKTSLFNKDVSAADNVSIFSLVTNHNNIFSSFYYTYHLTWITSNTLHTLATNIATFTTLPATQFEIKGFDGSIGVGYDLWSKGEFDYIGVGMEIGISTPWIDMASNGGGSFTFPTSTIDVTTYEVGPQVRMSRSWKNFSFYLNGGYAYETFRLKSSLLASAISVSGSHAYFDCGVRVDLFKKNYKIGFIPFSPRLYALAGFRWERWKSESFTFKFTTLAGVTFNSTMSANMRYPYFGIGYSF